MDKMNTPKVPSKKEFDNMTPEQKAARTKAAMMQNLNMTPEEKKAKEAKKKPAKKMMAGGMAKKYKAGGKVRGCGMARGGRVCKMVKMKGA